MLRLKFWMLLAIILLCATFTVGTAVAQESELDLSLSRDFGAGFGASIQGRFSFRVSGPENLVHVSFYIDDQRVGEDNQAPFRFQFETDEYALGTHSLYAIGTTENGRELTSNTLTRNFISSSSANRAILYIVIPILVISIGGILLSSWITGRGRKDNHPTEIKVHGPFGGTICPKCGKPFARHVWGLNVMIGKFDRCPHCGKWSLVRAMSHDVLDAAVAKMKAEATKDQNGLHDKNNDDAWQNRLEDSRFDS